jgi:putative pyruvate formate lyase activating enzyme
MPGKKLFDPRFGEMESVLSAFLPKELDHLSHCTLCPRNCGANRFSDQLGYCKSDASFRIASICIHKGEEPVISGKKGICNIFFPHCNLQCIYCQNHDISGNDGIIHPKEFSFEEVISKICETLHDTENIVGFVSPSHYIPQMLAIIRGIKATGANPVFVYNTNGYDTVDSLKMLEGIIDVYLPDFKYFEPELAFRYSQATNYPSIAGAALKEMYRQKGSTLILDENGVAQSGIIVRHLVLPNAIEQSIDVLRYIAEEISPKLHISLMSQYYPTESVLKHKHLGRSISQGEYEKIVTAFHDLGFYRGWVQNLASQASFRPNFMDEQPFEL